MNILIIGNGFDLAHGLKTTYVDFLNFCQNKDLLKYCNSSNCNDFLNYNLWLKHFLNRKEKIGNTWIDLENEIYEALKILGYYHIGLNITNAFSPKIITIKSSHIDFNFLNTGNLMQTIPESRIKQTAGYEFLKDHYYKDRILVAIYDRTGFINFLYHQLREFTMMLGFYLNTEIYENIAKIPRFNLKIHNNYEEGGISKLRTINFNYTNTIEQLYKPNIKPIYIHGNNLNNDSSDMILGTHNFNNREEEFRGRKLVFPPEINVFKKHNQRHKYSTIEPYQALLRELSSSRTAYRPPVFHVVGHSLNETDHSILEHIFKARKDAYINIYYHDETAQEKLITNITDMIGESEVTSKVRFVKQDDPARGILLESNNVKAALTK